MQIDETHSEDDLFNTSTEGTDGSMSDQDTAEESSELGGDWLDDGAKEGKDEGSESVTKAEAAKRQQVANIVAKINSGQKKIEDYEALPDVQWLIPDVKKELKTSNPEDIIAKAKEEARKTTLETIEAKQKEADTVRKQAEFDSLLKELDRSANPEQKKLMNAKYHEYVRKGMAAVDALEEAAERAGVDRTGTVRNRESFATVRSGGAPTGTGDVNWEDPNLDITTQSPAKLAKMAKMKR